jgi:hypothetical protein
MALPANSAAAGGSGPSVPPAALPKRDNPAAGRRKAKVELQQVGALWVEDHVRPGGLVP